MRRFQVGVTEARRDLIVQAAAALGALLIVISLFLPWFSVGLADSIKALARAGVEGEIAQTEELGGDLSAASELIDASLDFSGWASLEFADALLLFVAVAAVLLALGRRRGPAQGGGREAGEGPFLLGLLAVITVFVLLFTKNSVLGMVESAIGFGQDTASDLGQPGAGIDILSISPGAGLWLGLLGSLLVLLAGFFHSLVDPTATMGSTTPSHVPPAAPEATTTTASVPPPSAGTAEAPTTPQPQATDPPPRPPGQP